MFRLDESGEPQGGFDAIVGNPPFIGGKRISGALSKHYSLWIQNLNPGANGNADLVSHFFRRAFALIRNQGTFGLVATNTIAQGDTRRGGLTWICKHKGEIIQVIKRLPWPGDAAVVVSIIVIIKGEWSGARRLNNKTVPCLSAFLLPLASSDDPMPLNENRGRSFIGCDLQAQAFLFDDDDPDANSVDLMHELIKREPKNAERIFPFVGGEDLNRRWTAAPTRWVISFGNATQSEASQWKDLFEICRTRVVEERSTKSVELQEWPFWQFWRYRNEFWEAARGLDETIAISQTGTALAFNFVDLRAIYGHTVILLPTTSRACFAVLQSRIHYIWVSVFSSTIKDDLRYNPQDCFETFPFPVGYESKSSLEDAGSAYYHFRADLMVRNGEGLTKTSNRFHDPNEDSPVIVRLRELHAAMDRAVLDAYGWHDIQPVCEFIPEFDDEEEEDDNGRPKKKKFRYKWPEAIQDEVLARLIELNRQRAEEERRETELEPLTWEDGGTESAARPKRGRGKNGAKSDTIAEKPTLFNPEEQEV